MRTNNNIFKQLKALVYDVYDVENNVFRETPNGKYPLLNKDLNRWETAKLFVKLLLETDYFKKETSIYLLDPFSTNSRTLYILNKEYGSDLTSAALYQIWYRDREKFIKEFSDNFFVDLVIYEDVSVDKYREKLEQHIENIDNTSLLKECTLDLSCEEFKYEVTDEEFERFIQRIRPYINVNIDKTQESLENDMLAYINYITTHRSLTEVDRSRLKRLRKILING